MLLLSVLLFLAVVSYFVRDNVTTKWVDVAAGICDWHRGPACNQDRKDGESAVEKNKRVVNWNSSSFR
jgi:hypothetical protein